VEAERWILGVDGVRAVELLDALGEDVEQQRELGLTADDDEAFKCSARQWSGHSRRLQIFATPRCGAYSAFARRPAPPAGSSSVAPIALAIDAPCVLASLAFRAPGARDRKSTRLNSSHLGTSYAVFCLKK